MRTDPVAQIRRVSELVTVFYGPAVTFVFPDAKIRAYRRSVLQLKLISVIDGSTHNWWEQNVLHESMSEDLLFAKISEPDMTAVNSNGVVDRGHIEVFPKLWNLSSYDKMNGETSRVPQLIA